ncbi:MAG: CidA/LrgA family protein [Clostridia bacterium]|nr:CidA/LrgA family protein [Clostridia bacterium]
MEIVKQLVRILLFLYLGYVVEYIFNIPIPSNVIGMIFLIIALLTGAFKLEKIEETVNFIIKYLAVFYIVPCVGLILYLDLLKEQFVIIVIPILLSIIAGLFVAGKTTELLIRRGTGKDD